jgi:beta-phosphoglucomutase-like phosphatase (HAD superfamily)
MIKGVIYDLDGTIVDTADIHEAAWKWAAESIGISLGADLLIKQKGIPNEQAAQLFFPKQTQEERKEFIKKKNEYIEKNFGKFIEVTGIKEVVNELREKAYQIWICTGAPKAFVINVAEQSSVVESLQEKTVWREMYKQGKPFAEPLLVTLKQMNLQSDEVLFVGDAASDYQSAKAADIPFVYFCPTERQPNSEIPNDIPRLTTHKDILKYI